MNAEEFVKRAQKIHGNKYDYSKVNYVNSRTKVCIICPEHGPFWQTPANHINLKQNCPRCNRQTLPKTSEEITEKAREIFGNRYDYSKVNYKDWKTKICIICPEHGPFWKTPYNHIKLKEGCPACNGRYVKTMKFNLLQEFKDEYALRAFLMNGDINILQVILSCLEEKYELTTEEIERLKSRKRSWWADFKRVMIVGEDAANLTNYHVGSEADLLTTEALFKAEKEILMGIAEEESCVIAGRSAFFVLSGHPNRLSVLIQASMESRIERVMKKQNLSWKEAMQVINKVDKMREEYVKNYAHTSRYDTRNYDLVINMDGKTEEQAANLILSFID